MPFDAARVPWRVSASETGDIASSPPESVVEDRSTSAGQFQSLRDPSPEIVASVCPSAEKAIAKMASPACALGRVRTTWPRSTSTTWMVAAPATANTRSDGWKATPRLLAMSSTATDRPVAASHTSSVWASCPVVTTRDASGEKNTPSMRRRSRPGCTRTFQRSAPDGTSRAIRSSSKSPTTTRLPFGLSATAFTTGWRPAISSTRVAVTPGSDGAPEQAASGSASATRMARIRKTLRDNRPDASICWRAPRAGRLGLPSLRVGRRPGVRARTAHLLARAGLGAGLLAIVVMIARLYLPSGARDHPDDRLVAHFYLFGFALAAAGVVVLLLLLRH